MTSTKQQSLQTKEAKNILKAIKADCKKFGESPIVMGFTML